jgi:hypothetical protein
MLDHFVATAELAVSVYHPADLRDEYQAGQRAQRGAIESTDGVWRYFVHGLGCAYRTPDGNSIDLDVDYEPDRMPVFDVGRITKYGSESGLPVPPDEAIEQAATELANRSL